VRAVSQESVGGPEVLVLRELAEPPLEEGQELVTVHAAGINYADTLIRRGLYPQPPDLPWVPGSEVAGMTDGGRRVLGLLLADGGGGYAERAAVDGRWLFDLPAEASFAEGASFLLAFLTAWIPLTRQASVARGTRVLVHAAAGGVGTAAVQVAVALGADVVAATGSEAKLAVPLSLGAGQAVTYDRLGEVEPVDVVVDPVGGQLFADSIRLLRPLGVAVGIGFAGGLWPQVDPAQLVGRNVGVQGFYLGRLMQFRPELVRQAALDLLRLWQAGVLHPVVGASFPLEQAGEAHRSIEERRSTGKVVLLP
jgi:NADPH2:quinone reductase